MNIHAAILPVLDLLQGKVVRGVAGRRSEYRPIQSTLTTSTDALGVARALRDHFAVTEIYVADLDAIQFDQPNAAAIEILKSDGFQLWIDLGLRGENDPKLDLLDGAGVVVGLESAHGPDALQRIVARVGAQRVVFSLDLKNGQALGRVDRWTSDDPWLIARHAIESLGIRRMIVLDLAKVGVGEGVGTEDLCVRVKQAYPEVQLTAGGGVRGIEDVRRLMAMGIDRVLVASALHDGRITPADVKRLA